MKARGAPALVQAVRNGEVAVSAAAEVADLPGEEQERVVAEGPKAVKAAAKAKREEQVAALGEEDELLACTSARIFCPTKFVGLGRPPRPGGQIAPLEPAAHVSRVQFDGDELQAIGDPGGDVWVVVRSGCEPLGLSPHGQAERLKRTSWATTRMMRAVAQDGKVREVFCLHLKAVPLWLATIEASRVRPEVREKLERYQREAALFEDNATAGIGLQLFGQKSQEDLIAVFELTLMLGRSRVPLAQLVQNVSLLLIGNERVRVRRCDELPRALHVAVRRQHHLPLRSLHSPKVKEQLLLLGGGKP